MYAARSAKSDPAVNLNPLFQATQQNAELSAVLAEYSIASKIARVEPLVGHGGLSGARLWRVETRDAAFALRQWPVEHPSAERLRCIHAVLAHARDRGMAILPVPLQTRQGESFVGRQGRLWELASWLPGETSFEREPSAGKVASAMSVLGHFHVVTNGFEPLAHVESSIADARPRGSSPALLDRSLRLAELTGPRLASLHRVVVGRAIAPAIDQLARTILECLPGAAAVARPPLSMAALLHFPLQPCLRDIWHGNLLFIGDRVTGIVDFGAMYFDTPAMDVARLLGSMAGDDQETWQQGFARYEAVRPLSPNERAAIRAADVSGVVLGCVNWLEWLYVERRQFADLKAVETRMKSLAVRLQHLANA
jgi:homoserine kinase type II